VTDYGARYETARDRCLTALLSLDWVSWKTLRLIGGVRYSARLLELKRLGYKIEDRSDPSGDGKNYRLLDRLPSAPQIKLVKVYLPENDAALLAEGVATINAIYIVDKALRIFRANKHKL
jgi:hypothetical protein